MTSTWTRRAAGIAAVAALLVAVAGCGVPPDTRPVFGAYRPIGGFLPCLVSDDGGFHDRSFNQSAHEGMVAAGKELDVAPIFVESGSTNDYGPNLEALVAEGCTFIISVGFKLSAATITSALATPDVEYAIIDDWADNSGAFNDSGDPIGDGVTDAPNIKPLLFDTVQAAFLGGYAAAAWSAASGVNKVGTVGGVPIPPVTIFMDGFVDGVQKYNADNDADVATFGWDVSTQQGSFTGGFAANDTAKQAMQGVLDQGVDVLLPVGGPIYRSARDAIVDTRRDAVMLGVDSDLVVSDPDVADRVLVSILKRIDKAVYDTTLQAAAGEFDTEPYVGTLENEGVGLSSFHDFESRLPAGLTDKLQQLQEQIVSGALTVTSPASPRQ